jgi:hypothetical protein
MVSPQLRRNVHGRDVHSAVHFAELSGVALIVLQSALANPQDAHQSRGDHMGLMSMLPGPIRHREGLRRAFHQHSPTRHPFG